MIFGLFGATCFNCFFEKSRWLSGAWLGMYLTSTCFGRSIIIGIRMHTARICVLLQLCALLGREQLVIGSARGRSPEAQAACKSKARGSARLTSDGDCFGPGDLPEPCVALLRWYSGPRGDETAALKQQSKMKQEAC